MFSDRHQAGVALARALSPFADDSPTVLALPRGGLPVAREVAHTLSAPLDVLIVRKLGAPHNPEFAFGAVGEGGVVVVDHGTIAGLDLGDVMRDRLITEATTEVARRVDSYRHGRALADVSDRTVIIVDDGLATGATAEVAARVVRALGARRIILAVPTGSSQAVKRLESVCDEVVCLEVPDWFGSVGSQYGSFPQVTDDEVTAILNE